MREAMHAAEVGDDVYGEDPTVNALEAYAANLLGKQAALYCVSGTQSNLIGLLTHCNRGDEYLVGQTAHTYRLEGGGAAALGGIQPQPLPLDDQGQMSLTELVRNIKPDDFHFARSRVVCLENTHNGIVLKGDYIRAIKTICTDHNLKLHLDGARFFNAVIESGEQPEQLATCFDSISICLSKGLGAPVGSLLLGSKDYIRQARRWRKVVGGGMRQAGVVAAAGLYALEHHIERLGDDHRRAEAVSQALIRRFGEYCVRQRTNMIHLEIGEAMYAALRDHLGSCGIRVGRPRWVFHLDVGDTECGRIIQAIGSFENPVTCS